MKINSTEGKLKYLVIERIVLAILFFIASVMCMDQEGMGSIGHIIWTMISIIFIVGFLYNLKYFIYILLDFKDGPEVRCMEYLEMKTEELHPYGGLIGADEVYPEYADVNKWISGKIWFCTKQSTIENRLIYKIMNWIYRRVTTSFYIEPSIRRFFLNIMNLKKEACVYRGIFKGKIFREIYRTSWGAEVVYYRRSRLIKELRLCEDMTGERKVKVFYEKNKRYEFVGIKNLKNRRDYSILLQILMQVSEDKKVFVMIMDEDKVKGINKDTMVHYWKDSELKLCVMELPGLNKNTVNTDLFKNKEMYLTICTAESDLTWNKYTHDEDPFIWNIDEGKVCAYIHVSDKDGVEITGAPGLKEIETISERLKRESSV
ncbi:hypothetical protein [Dorea sp.]